jgi:hypothetical protein
MDRDIQPPAEPRIDVVQCAGGPRVEAYSDRFTVQFTDGVTHTVLASDITSVRVTDSTMRVAHTAPGLASPVRLNLAAASQVRQVIERLHPDGVQLVRRRWRWNWEVTRLMLGGLVIIGLGTYFLAGDSPVYTAVWIGIWAVVVGQPIRRAGLKD